MRINLTDNNIGQTDECIFNRKDISVLFPLANKTVANLCEEHKNLLLFPPCITSSDDKLGESSLLSIENTDDSEKVRLTTGNIVGFFGVGNLKIKIKSRFDKDSNDYFLHYMLQKVLSFNLFDLNHDDNEEDVFDFLTFMFPYFLKTALRQGIYREYRRAEYDDSRIRGAVDVGRFIRKDMPFHGKIAYSVRNFSYDNDMTQLIRHTIEYLKNRKFGQYVLNVDSETIDNVRTVIDNTPGYDRHERDSVIRMNLRPKVHPFYTEYQPLQSLCLQILRKEGIKYGEANNEICGILIDASWLWEEYINTILEPIGFLHPENKIHKGGFHLFEDRDEMGYLHRSGIRFPDFYKKNFVLDAKYKKFGNYNKVSKVERNDIHQLVTYMTALKSVKGGFVVPLENACNVVPTSHLKDSNAQISIYGIEITQSPTSFENFKIEMKKSEENFVESLKN